MGLTLPSEFNALAVSGVSLISPADTNNNILFSYFLPGGLMGLNSRLEIYYLGTNTNSANTKSFRTYMGCSSPTALDGALVYSVAVTTNTLITSYRCIQNRNSLNSQVAYTPLNSASFGNVAGTPGIFAVNTAIGGYINFSILKAAGADNAAYENIFVNMVTP